MNIKAKTLVVDDNKIYRDALCKTLKKINCECITLNYCEDALELLKRQSFDVIFLDLKMPQPHMDGLEALEKMKELGVDLSRIVIVTGGKGNDKEQVMRLGITTYLKKGSFRIEKVKEIIKNLLSK